MKVCSCPHYDNWDCEYYEKGECAFDYNHYTKCECGGEWRTDGQHSNEFCEKCLKSRK